MYPKKENLRIQSGYLVAILLLRFLNAEERENNDLENLPVELNYFLHQLSLKQRYVRRVSSIKEFSGIAVNTYLFVEYASFRHSNSDMFVSFFTYFSI